LVLLVEVRILCRLFSLFHPFWRAVTFSFRRFESRLRRVDQEVGGGAWSAVTNAAESEQQALTAQIRPPRIAHAFAAALDLGSRNAGLRRHLPICNPPSTCARVSGALRRQSGCCNGQPRERVVCLVTRNGGARQRLEEARDGPEPLTP